MHVWVAELAGVWITILLVVMIAFAVAAKSSAERMVAIDALALILAALLVLASAWSGRSYFLDAALALALVSFVGPIAAARRRSGEPIL